MNDARRLGYPAAAGELFTPEPGLERNFPLGVPRRVTDAQTEARGKCQAEYDRMHKPRVLLKYLTRGDYDALTGVHLVPVKTDADYAWLRNTSIQIKLFNA